MKEQDIGAAHDTSKWALDCNILREHNQWIWAWVCKSWRMACYTSGTKIMRSFTEAFMGRQTTTRAKMRAVDDVMSTFECEESSSMGAP